MRAWIVARSLEERGCAFKVVAAQREPAERFKHIGLAEAVADPGMDRA